MRGLAAPMAVAVVIAAATLGFVPEQLLGQLAGPDNPLAVPVAAALPRPGLLTQGDQSPPLFAPVIPKLADAVPSAEVSRLTGAGHFIQAELPEAYVEALATFAHRHTT